MREGAQEFPLMVVLSFVYVCNAKCPNCPYNNSTIRNRYKDALFMAEEVFKRIADECAKYSAYLRISGGGEPMLHPKATDLLIYAKRKGARIGLITNGSIFDEENLEALIESEVDNLEFSVDAGDEETYGQVRCGLDWKKVNRNVNMAVAIRDRLKSRTRIIASIIDQQGVDVEMAERHWQNIVDKVQIRKFLTWGYNVDCSGDPTPYLPPEERIPCPWLFERLNIDTRGDVTLCGEDIAFDHKFANIFEKSIKEIWLGSEFEDFRAKHLSGRGHKIPICLSCPDWQYRSWNYNYWKIISDAEHTKTKSRRDEAL
jgi:radical SAM protein with 4Fe4S-binding SPASM domain